ncbi:hypothetical protein O181_090931 [Austropuccinia psidii MF-1]|uniref:Reverse transcriptase Ty1/copia-type domain-containing protein n=1 Tax=Austropuccinia psidii MF-1 TaxID=1389203 RepID=A0A9Q3IWF1_9BASI|nr:hypothetical protein [Austropuccinia psidii MF-1]
MTANSALPANCKLESNFSLKKMDKPYLKQIGMLLYIAQALRPDIAYAVNYLALFSLKTNQHHWNALENLIAYFRGTTYDGILIRKNQDSQQMKCYIDANWGGEASRLTHGYVILHGKNPIAWQLRRQTTVASSMAQAEYMALSFAAKEMLWMYNLFCKTIDLNTPILLSDNKMAVGISTDSMSKKQTQHLIREFNVINEYIVMKKMELKWVAMREKLADIMTKPLRSVKTQ